MSTAWMIVAGLAGLVVVIYLLILLVGALSVLGLSNATIRELSPDDSAALRKLTDHIVPDDWPAAHGFEYLGAFELNAGMGRPLIVAWQQAGSPTYLCCYLINQQPVNADIVSVYDLDRQVGLTTGTSKDGHLMPRPPGKYMQTFTGADVDTLWQVHTAAEPLVAELTGVEPGDVTISFQDLLLTAIVQDVAHVRGLTLWPMRLPLWYFIRRNRYANKTVHEQVDAGL